MDYTHQWSSEVDKMTQSFIEENFAPDHGVYEDILTRGKVDVPINGYCAGFPCTPFSLLRSNSGCWEEAAAGPAREVLKTVEHARPCVAILENVEGLKKRPDTWGKFRELISVHMRGYRIHLLHLCPTDLGHVSRRPRLFLLAIRRDVLVNDADTVKQLLFAAQQVFRARDQTPWLRNDSCDESKQNRDSRDENVGRSLKWPALHEQIWKKIRMEQPNPRGCLTQAADLPFLTAREKDILHMQQHLYGDHKYLAVDVSQSASRVPVRCDGTIPVLARSSRIILCSPQGVWMMSGKDKLAALEAPFHEWHLGPAVTDAVLSRWAGNSMHLRCISLAWMTALLLVDWDNPHAAPGFKPAQEELQPCTLCEWTFSREANEWFGKECNLCLHQPDSSRAPRQQVAEAEAQRKPGRRATKSTARPRRDPKQKLAKSGSAARSRKGACRKQSTQKTQAGRQRWSLELLFARLDCTPGSPRVASHRVSRAAARLKAKSVSSKAARNSVAKSKPAKTNSTLKRKSIAVQSRAGYPKRRPAAVHVPKNHLEDLFA